MPHVPNSYWLVWNEDGGPPRVKHAGVEAAEAEALRLARAHPGTSFTVLEPVARFTVRDVEIERFDIDDRVPF